MRVVRALSTGLVAMLLLSACANDDEQNDPPPIPDDAADEPNEPDDPPLDDENEDDEIDVSTVPADPDDITIEYVQAVMDELDPLIAATAAVIHAQDDAFDPNAQELIFQAYSEASGQAQLETFAGVGPENVRQDPGPPDTDVSELFEQHADCVVFSAERSFRPLLAESVDYDPVQPYYLRLIPGEATTANPTPWRIDFDSYFEDPDEEPEGDVCGHG